MLDVVLNLIPGGGLTAILAAVLAALAGAFGIYRTGRKAERAQQDAKRLRDQVKAQQDRLAMRQEGDTAEQNAKRLSDEAARKEAMRWSGK